MIRVSTALLALLSIVATPLASMVCMTRCGLFLMHQHPVCHDKSHAYTGSHTHRMNHVHMVNRTEPVLAAHDEQSRHLVASSGCLSGSCMSMSPAVPRRTTVQVSELQAFSHVPAATVYGSLPVSSQNFSNIAVPPSGTAVYSISTPLRI